MLVLDKGQVAEFDSPKQLLKNQESHFTKLVNQMQEEEKEGKAAEWNRISHPWNIIRIFIMYLENFNILFGKLLFYY